eukprot:COSAG04_NODE_2175_length_4628_cov_4.893133_4_plen_93_part_00
MNEEQEGNSEKGPDNDQAALRAALDHMGLLSLYPLLQEEGVGALEDLALLSNTDLKEIGVARKVDRVKLLNIAKEGKASKRSWYDKLWYDDL